MKGRRRITRTKGDHLGYPVSSAARSTGTQSSSRKKLQYKKQNSQGSARFDLLKLHEDTFIRSCWLNLKTYGCSSAGEANSVLVLVSLMEARCPLHLPCRTLLHSMSRWSHSTGSVRTSHLCQGSLVTCNRAQQTGDV